MTKMSYYIFLLLQGSTFKTGHRWLKGSVAGSISFRFREILQTCVCTRAPVWREKKDDANIHIHACGECWNSGRQFCPQLVKDLDKVFFFKLWGDFYGKISFYSPPFFFSHLYYVQHHKDQLFYSLTLSSAAWWMIIKLFLLYRYRKVLFVSVGWW